jgi:spore coat polysaccharide biosynthesis protein SpsF (cytidylyltransferase family)
MPVDDPHRRPFRLTLDQREDYDLLTAVFEALYRPGAPFTTEDVIRFLEARPELLAKNAGVRGKAVSLNTTLRIGA